MRSIVWTGFLTVDGVMDSPGGIEEGHPAGGWVLRTTFLPEVFALKDEELAETSALLLGRQSYEAFAPVWSQSAEHAAYQDLPKFVVSTTLAQSDLLPGWGPTTILRSTADVADLKETPGGSIFIHGSGALATSLADADLIDRYNILQFPVLLGEGKRIFTPTIAGERRLALRESAHYPNGVVKLLYDVTR